MIRDIRDVRASRNNLNIDMRIGVHSGSIMSGVIGACKWQYDIWSKDVSIANRLETTGMPGYESLLFFFLSRSLLLPHFRLFMFFFRLTSKVHITQQTLELLEDQYFFEPGTEAAKKDPILIKNNIETFLISPQYYFGGDSQVSFLLIVLLQTQVCLHHCFVGILFFSQYYSPDELNRRYEKTSSIGSKRVVSRTGRNNVSYLHNSFC